MSRVQAEVKWREGEFAGAIIGFATPFYSTHHFLAPLIADRIRSGTALRAPSPSQLDFSRLCRYLMGQYVTVHGDVISHLNISVSEVEDGGLYSCVAANRAGSATHSSRLNIYGPPIIRPFPASGLKAVEGRAFVVRCPVAGFPIEEVAWKKGELISNSIRCLLHP